MTRKLFLLVVFTMSLTGCMQAVKSFNVASNEPLPSEVTPEKKLTHVYIMLPPDLFNVDIYDLYFGTTQIASLRGGDAVHLKLFPNKATYQLTIKKRFQTINIHGIRTTVITTAQGKGGRVSYFIIDTPLLITGDIKLAPIAGQQGLQTLKKYRLVKPLVSETTIAFAGKSTVLEDRDACIKSNQLDKCLKLQSELPANLVPAAVTERTSQLQAQEAQEVQRQKLDALEAKLPVNVRRDKYMVQLSSFLKQQKYQDALAIFPKLEDLPIATDPSLKYFYGESLLKTGQTAKALQELYQYINEQGTGAAHYAQALEMINQAESKL